MISQGDEKTMMSLKRSLKRWYDTWTMESQCWLFVHWIVDILTPILAQAKKRLYHFSLLPLNIIQVLRWCLKYISCKDVAQAM